MALNGYFIQYKFIIPESIKHSSYAYQKLFRAIYGYTQNVTKSNGKSYRYRRSGVLSGVPYLRPGKNCVIIPSGVFNQLITFFKTGKNPSHYWRGKGDWKAVYYMDEKTIPETDAISALEAMLDRQYVLTASEAHEKLTSEVAVLVKGREINKKTDEQYRKILLNEAEKVVGSTWFRACYSKSPALSEFYADYKLLKGA